MRVPIAMERFVNLNAGDVSYTGPSELTQFQIIEPVMKLIDPKYLVVKITFKRMFAYHIFVTFGPTTILLIITQLTLFVGSEEHFDVNVMVHLTTMLVMYTLYASTSNSMPHTAYLKFIDIFLLYGLTLPFIAFLVEVITKIIRSHKKIEYRGYYADVITKMARICLPIITLLFILVYVIIAIILFWMALFKILQNDISNYYVYFHFDCNSLLQSNWCYGIEKGISSFIFQNNLHLSNQLCTQIDSTFWFFKWFEKWSRNKDLHVNNVSRLHCIIWIHDKVYSNVIITITYNWKLLAAKYVINCVLLPLAGKLILFDCISSSPALWHYFFKSNTNFCRHQ